MKPVRNMTPVVFLVLMIALVASVGCDSSNNPTNPASGGGSADIDVLNSTPASGNTNISGSAVTVSTTLDDHGNPGPTDPPTKFATLGQAVPASMVLFPAPWIAINRMELRAVS